MGGGWLLTTKNPASSPSSPVLPSSVLRHILLVCHRHLFNNLFHFHLRLIFCCHISRRRIFQDLTCDVIFRNYDVIVPKCFLINITSSDSNFRKVMHSYHQSNSSGKNHHFPHQVELTSTRGQTSFMRDFVMVHFFMTIICSV